MFLKKLEKFYSYNLLSILGWCSLLIQFLLSYESFFTFKILFLHDLESLYYVPVILFSIFLRSFGYLCLSIVVFFIEIIFSIKKKEVSDSKKLSQLKLIGVLLVLLPLIIIGGIFSCLYFSAVSHLFTEWFILYLSLIILPILILSYFSYRRKKNK